jgi:4-hydroxybenzoate polyprenyltransferase
MRDCAAVREALGDPSFGARLGGYVALGRLAGAGAGAIPYTIGPLMAGASFGVLVTMFGLGVVVHVLACSLNDMADLELDRQHPKRQRSPLVAGTLSGHQALLGVTVQSGLVAALLIVVRGPVGASLATIVIITAYGYVNIFQKRSRLVPAYVMDDLFGLVSGAPVIATLYLTGFRPTASDWAIACSIACLSIVLNAVSGNLKDLPHDLDYGVRTTVLELGVRLGSDGISFTPRYRVYVMTAQLGATVTAVLAAAVGSGDRALPAAMLSGVLGGLACWNVMEITRPTERDGIGRPWYSILNVVTLFVAATSSTTVLRAVGLLTAVLVIPVLVLVVTNRIDAVRMLLHRLLSAR